MAKKYIAEDIILAGFDLSRKEHPTMGKMNDSEFVGYVTAMSNSQNLSKGVGIEEYLRVARQLVEEGRL